MATYFYKKISNTCPKNTRSHESPKQMKQKDVPETLIGRPPKDRMFDNVLTLLVHRRAIFVKTNEPTIIFVYKTSVT